MDKKTGQLNPQLKQIYDRIMETNVNVKHQDPMAPPSQPAPPINKKKEEPPISPLTTIQERKKGNPTLTIIVVLLGIIFFAVYAFFWTKFFSLKLPFPLPF